MPCYVSGVEKRTESAAEKKGQIKCFGLSKRFVATDEIKLSNTQEIIILSKPFVSELLETAAFTLLLHYVVQ